MRKQRLFGEIRHASLMVCRTVKSYLLLSVTVVLSFSLLLGYFCYTDSNLINQYKTLFSYRRGDIYLYDSIGNHQRLQTLMENISEVGTTKYYIAYEGNGGRTETMYTCQTEGSDDLSSVFLSNWYLFYYPDHAWTTSLLDLHTGDIVWTDGRTDQSIKLDPYDAIINEGLYFALGFDKMQNPVYTFKFENGESLTLNIVGYAMDKIPFTIDWEHGTEGYYYRNQLILSTKILDAEELWDSEGMVTGRYIVIHTDNPEQILNLAQRIGYNTGQSAFMQQNEALEAIRYEKKNKAIIACALFLLLGINLYSSFINALNDRKFEIGVKRAIGASSWSIVRQFLYESLMVMVANILLSVVLVTDVFIIYKFIYERTPDEWGNLNQWIIYISPHSVFMFSVCAVSLTIVFSLIFAYKSTRVEIVQYLKAE